MYQTCETYRGVVYPTALDHVGHMNVQSYTARFDEASWHFLARIGLTPSHIRETRHAAVAADQHTQYKCEVLAGSLLHVTTELLQVGRKSVRFVHRMFDSESETEVATMEVVGVYFDLERRVSVSLPAIVHASAALLEVETAAC